MVLRALSSVICLVIRYDTPIGLLPIEQKSLSCDSNIRFIHVLQQNFGSVFLPIFLILPLREIKIYYVL